VDPALVAIVAALIGAGSSIAATALTMAWTGRHETERQTREEAAALRAEKRGVYRDLIQALDAWREATVEIADGDRKKRDWDWYWQCREACMKAGATVQLVGTDDMLEAAGEAMETLLDVAWRFHTHTALAYGAEPPTSDEISKTTRIHIGVADREEATLLDLMRVELGFSPLIRERRTPAPSGASTRS
jgi:hypothetical protein